MSLVLGDIVLGQSSGEGVAFKQPVLVATTQPNSINVDFRSGSSIDNIVLSTGDRILVKNQNSKHENGIYTINASGSPTRADDFLDEANVAGFIIYVEFGDVNSATVWICTSDKPNDMVGDDDMYFKLLSDTNHPGNHNNPHHIRLEQARSMDNSMNGNVEFASGTIKGLPTPVDPNDVCNKKYVDDNKLHMIDPRMTVSITYDDQDRVVLVEYGNGERKQIQYHTTKNVVNAIVYTTDQSTITKFFQYNNGFLISTSISKLLK